MPTASAAAPLADPDGQFRRNYNAASFAFPHGLTGNPLFALDSLLALARRTPTTATPTGPTEPWV